MDERFPDQLDKILAMADSSNEWEAVTALRKARDMLVREGLRFGDLARAAFLHKETISSSGVSSALMEQRERLEVEVRQLRQQLDYLGSEARGGNVPSPDGRWLRRVSDRQQDNVSSDSGYAKKVASLYESMKSI